MYRRTNIIVRAIVVVLLLFISFSIIEMQVQLKNIRSRRDAVQREIYSIEDDIAELKGNIAEAKEMSDAYIARVAIDKLGYRHRGEIVFYNDVAN